MAVKVAILGPTGYTGLHLIQLLLGHPDAQVTYLASRRDELPDITEVFPQLLGRIDPDVALCRPVQIKSIAADADVAFLALPHRVAMQYVPALLEAGVAVIDLSADYRLTDAALYEKVYEHPHEDRDNLSEAVYGLPELFRSHLSGAALVANPGCYPTCAAIGLAPLLQQSLVQPEGIIINAASGVTGAGRKPVAHLQFAEQNESYHAYGKIGGHRHQPEIIQTLSMVAGRDIDVLFVPHLLPIDSGILETIYLDPVDPNVTQLELLEAFAQAYADEPFVRVRQTLPDVKHVVGTNFCDVAVRLVDLPAGPKIVVFAALDNMIKGACGQAIQNMNMVFKLDETSGLL